MTKAESHQEAIAYRPDIDGLRALAVTSVITFHLFPNLIPGGFIGVDIFFVISGFLISSIIFKNLNRDLFSLADFYARRIKRIFPALITVLLATYGLGWLYLFSDEFALLNKHILAGTAFLSNILLWRETGYFDAVSETKPLLHTWSLGVEEQFYLIWPCMIWMAWRMRIKPFLLATAILGLSFWINVTLTDINPSSAFYLPQSRFWELMSGSLLAWVSMFGVLGARIELGNKSITTLSNLVSISGLLLLCFGLGLIDRSVKFPGYTALIPVLGALCLITSGPESWVNKFILGNPVIRWLGLISYPLYLWHRPLITFARIAGNDFPDRQTRVFILLLSVLLAWLTYRFIETPIRYGRQRIRVEIPLSLGMVMMAALALTTYGNQGFPFREEEKNKFLEGSRLGNTETMIAQAPSEACNFYDIRAWREGHESLIPRVEISRECFTRDLSKPKAVFIWGDSHAQHLNYGLMKNLPSHWQVLQVASSNCPANIGPLADVSGNWCDKSNHFALEVIDSIKPDVVVLAQNTGHDIQRLDAIAQHLSGIGIKRVVFVGPVPHWRAELPKIIVRSLWVYTPDRTSVGLDKSYLSLNDALREESASRGMIYADAISLFCDTDGCIIRFGDDRQAGLTSLDEGHLLPVASSFLAKRLLVPMIVGEN